MSMSATDQVSSTGTGKWTATILPAACTVAVYAWAVWCFGSPAAPSTTVAVAVGAAAILVAAVAYYLLVDGVVGFWGALALTGGLLLAVASADQSAGRSAVADCVVVRVWAETRESFGEGGAEKTLHHHTLRCPGGYPATLAEDRRVAPDGGTVRVAYDPRRRVGPAVEGSTSPWRPALLAVPLLAAATAGAWRFSRADRQARRERREREEREARHGPSSRRPPGGGRGARGGR
ncbi:hypothetical protein DEJ44_11330 [Streptomyces venezuelae]|nr:hypothetical protein DEJ44_11330 [Streptomyces venezuelae]